VWQRDWPFEERQRETAAKRDSDRDCYSKAERDSGTDSGVTEIPTVAVTGGSASTVSKHVHRAHVYAREAIRTAAPTHRHADRLIPLPFA
jgi:hypothetical protein